MVLLSPLVDSFACPSFKMQGVCQALLGTICVLQGIVNERVGYFYEMSATRVRNLFHTSSSVLAGQKDKRVRGAYAQGTESLFLWERAGVKGFVQGRKVLRTLTPPKILSLREREQNCTSP